MKKSQPIRMCIACRSRHPQKSLIRLKHDGKEIVQFNGMGRSFYLCKSCVKDDKKLKGLAKRFKQDAEQLARLLGTLA
ncbi:YlxR family protein [Sulfurovum sp. NBC37-1]|uniref:YlxR family protein n=1 Tax=Sulfurovum sp. (strain NBC37-1) TaxID=387093 RepID=UPI0001587D32|nr:DUF448 domain-containing protein [Sulfurovum sp. NBC37-1]BAF72915.1 conserved hypothetical protein [Sulfurovum sp. NBC37-1]